MIERILGGAGVRLPVIGQGTWNMERGERTTVLRALQAGIDAGSTHIDTAEMYGGGEVERIVGEAIRERREETFLVSKVLPSNASKTGTVRACEESLERLGTDHLDLYLLHWPGSHPLEDTFEAFELLLEAGKIRHCGVSNFDSDELEHAVAVAGPGRIACNQVLYHLHERTIEHFVIPDCERHGIAVVAYSPFGSGEFPSEGPGVDVLDEIARERDATRRQLALAFLTRRDSVLAIPKAARADHARENAAAGDLVLTEAEVERIDAAFPLGKATRRLPVI